MNASGEISLHFYDVLLSQAYVCTKELYNYPMLRKPWVKEARTFHSTCINANGSFLLMGNIAYEI